MAIVVAGSVLYLCLTLRGQLLHPVAAFQEPPVDKPPVPQVIGVLTEPIE